LAIADVRLSIAYELTIDNLKWSNGQLN